MSDTSALHDVAEHVRTQDDLVAFIGRLRQDLHECPKRWLNGELGSFLEAMAGWARDMDGYYRSQGKSLAQVPPVQLLAHMLLAARGYE